MPVPTELPTKRKSRARSEGELVALFSLVPWIICLVLARAYPAIAHAYVLLGQIR
jgi:hypothetical protein